MYRTHPKDCERVVRSNWDVFIQSSTDNDFIQWYKDRLTENNYQYLGSLPFNSDLKLNGQLIRFSYTFPRSEFERILISHPIEKRLSMFGNSEVTNLINYNKLPDIVFCVTLGVSEIHLT